MELQIIKTRGSIKVCVFFGFESISEELADVLIYCVLMSDAIGLDINQIVKEKLLKNNEKYPVDKVYGKSAKYTEL